MEIKNILLKEMKEKSLEINKLIKKINENKENNSILVEYELLIKDLEKIKMKYIYCIRDEIEDIINLDNIDNSLYKDTIYSDPSLIIGK